MIKPFQPQKGFNDFFADACQKRQFLISECNHLALLAGFVNVDLPFVETFRTFSKPFALNTQTKDEFFTLCSKSAANPTETVLRPELTSGLIRAYLNQPLWCQKAGTFFTSGPCFRYEKPQKGRFRQFWQWNLEQFRYQHSDLKSSLAFLARLINHFALTEKVEIIINFLTPAKLTFFNHYLQNLSAKARQKFCQTCQNRFLNTGNLYRILDCTKCQVFFQNHFHVTDQLTTDEIKQFQQIQQWLKTFCPTTTITLDPLLVRGLNYYEQFVFEVKLKANVLQWAQNTLIAGGQYQLKSFFTHSLTNQASGFGFAIGIDRLIIALNAFSAFKHFNSFPSTKKLILIGYLKANDFAVAYKLQTSLQKQNYLTKVIDSKQHFRDLHDQAIKEKADYLLVFDHKYLQTQQIFCKPMKKSKRNNEQAYFAFTPLITFLTNEQTK